MKKIFMLLTVLVLTGSLAACGCTNGNMTRSEEHTSELQSRE